jgi:CRISPR-associated protein Csd2
LTELKARIDFVYLFDVQDGNPSGEPDIGALPRSDIDRGASPVTNVCSIPTGDKTTIAKAAKQESDKRNN